MPIAELWTFGFAGVAEYPHRKTFSMPVHSLVLKMPPILKEDRKLSSTTDTGIVFSDGGGESSLRTRKSSSITLVLLCSLSTGTIKL